MKERERERECGDVIGRHLRVGTVFGAGSIDFQVS